MAKKRVGFYLEIGLLKKCDAYLERAGASSRNEFVSKAVSLYVGALESEDSQQYLAAHISEAIAGAVGVSENRVARLLFKLSVEISILMNVLAAMADVDADTLRQLRGKCVEDVKRSNGAVSFEETVRRQSRRE